MTYHYKGEEIENRAAAVKFILTLPYNELYNFVYSYLDQFTESHLKDLIWASLTNGLWTMRDLIEDALLMMENDWDSYPEGYLSKGDTVNIGDLEYENWEVPE